MSLPRNHSALPSSQGANGAKRRQILPRSLAALDDLDPAPSWRKCLAEAIRDPVELLRRLELPDRLIEPAKRAAKLFPLLVPRPFIARMKIADPRDPLLRQVLPLTDELFAQSPGYSRDPLAEGAATPTTGLLHKYQGRALLIASPTCAVHCRYCFRRHFPYQETSPTLAQWRRALDYVAQQVALTEVILSGGDPLTLSDRRLEQLVALVAAIPHVEMLRIHTRLPIVIPQRVTARLVQILRSARLRTTLVLHVNHANEIDDAVARAVDRLSAAGVTLLNQAVLLRGVNDGVAEQRDLGIALHRIGVLPYYLHLLDKVSGAEHFDVPDAAGAAMISVLRTQLPGYLVPRLVREVPGEAAKRIIA